MNARALDRCTVNQPSAPCQMISPSAKLDAKVERFEVSSLRRMISQFRITRGPRIAPANSL